MSCLAVVVPFVGDQLMMFSYRKLLRVSTEKQSDMQDAVTKAAKEQMGVEGFILKVRELEFLPSVPLEIYTVDVRQQTEIKNREQVSLEDAKNMSDSGKINDVITSLAIQLLYSANKRG